MLFNSYLFIFTFLPCVLLGFYFLGSINRSRLAIVWLVFASLFFYGWWNPAYLWILLFSIATNYAISNAIEYSKQNKLFFQSKTYLVIGIIINIAILGYFKYANFFVDSINQFTGSSFHLEKIILPLAISFFTFQQIAYLVDVYRDNIRERNFIDYCLFVSFFPQLIAGPIVHHHEMMPQFRGGEFSRFMSQNIIIGMTIFSIGLFKKVIIADGLAAYVDPVFAASNTNNYIPLTYAWSASIAYSFQIYFDFSGYSDMAIGLGRMFGIKLPFNFNSPYKAVNIFDLWQRWHMTLSRFMRNHVYYPLARNKVIKLGHHTSLVISVLLGGLWHGANWTFIAWGGLHGILMLVNHIWHVFRRSLGHDLSKRIWWGVLIGMSLTFFSGLLTRVFFRADSLDSAIVILTSMVGSINQLPANETLSLMSIGITDFLIFFALLMFVWFAPNTQELLIDYDPGLDPYQRKSRRKSLRQSAQSTSRFKFTLNYRWAMLVGFLLVTAIMGIATTTQFIYFQF